MKIPICLSASERTCFWNAWARNMIGYSAFFTMAGIALTRCVNIVFSQSRLTRIREFFTPRKTMVSILFIWVFTFIMMTPTTFGARVLER